MSDFKTAILFVLRNEGGYSNHKNDRGGATNYGISTRFLKQADEDIDGDGHVTSEDVKSLTEAKSIDLYEKHFWKHYKLECIRDQQIATKALDIFVNMRGKSAASILQNACNSLGSNLQVDGICGSKTFAEINDHSNFSIGKAALMDEIRSFQKEHYLAIIENDKKQKKFKKGWLARAAK